MLLKSQVNVHCAATHFSGENRVIHFDLGKVMHADLPLGSLS